MAIKLDVYLKRTEQSFSDWLAANNVAKVEDLQPRAAFLGLSVSLADIAEARRILAIPVVIPTVEIVSDVISEKKQKRKKLE